MEHDESALQSVVLNLLTNASESLAEESGGGAIDLDADEITELAASTPRIKLTKSPAARDIEIGDRRLGRLRAELR